MRSPAAADLFLTGNITVYCLIRFDLVARRTIADQMPSQQKTLIYSFVQLMFAVLIFGNTGSLFALQDDPFGDPFGGGATKKQNADDDPFNPGANKPAAGGPAKTTPGNAALPNSVDKVVLAIRETNPTTPSEFIRALRIMFDTQNFDEAKAYLAKLEAANLNDSAAFDLVKEIGSDFMVRLIRSEQMAPKGASFGRSLMSKSTRHLKSDAQLAIYFGDINSPSPTKRNSAAKAFSRAGVEGLAFLVKSSPSVDPADLKNYEVTAALMGSSVVKPLESILETGDEKQQLFAISALGRANSQKSVVFLLGPLHDPKSPASIKTAATNSFKRMLGGVPGLAESKKHLRKKLNDLIKGARPYYINAFGQTEFWTWTADGKFVKSMLPPKVASVLLMERLGRALYSIDTSDPESETLFLATQLTALKTLGQKSVAESVQSSSLSVVKAKKWVEILEFCLKNKLLAGAAGACEAIEKTGDESLMKTTGFSPLVRAMQAGDRELRYASTKAIIGLNPKRGFPGANHFVDSIVYFAGTKGYRKALVAHPKFSEGQNLVGSLAQRGFDADAVTTGRDLFRAASLDSDVEFILISDAIDRPNLGELMVQIRSQPSLSRLPIGILSQKMNHDKNVRIASFDPRTLVMKQPYRISFRVEQILPEDNIELNNAIITWSVLSDILEQALAQKNRTVAIQILETMRAAFNDNLSKLAVDNSAIEDAMKDSDQAIRSRASRLYLRVTGDKPLYEKPIEQPTTSGRVLIVHPQSGEILPLQQKLQEVGYTVAVMNSVENAVKVIPNIPSLRFVIGSKEFGGLGEVELKKALAKKFRLNPVPVTFVSRADSYREAPVAKPVFDSQLEQLLKLGDSHVASGSERVAQAKTCLAFLKNVVSDRKSYSYADPIRHEKKIVDSIQNRDLTLETLAVLGELATPTAQKAIVDLASEASRSEADRKAAVQALATAIKKRGILLTKAAILEQYARYNKSETLDQGTQQILGSILDVIEAPKSSN